MKGYVSIAVENTHKCKRGKTSHQQRYKNTKIHENYIN